MPTTGAIHLDGQPRYYGEGGRKEYVYTVTEKPLTLGAGEGSFTPTYDYADGVHTITNTYVQPRST